MRIGITAPLAIGLTSCSLLGPAGDLERFAEGDREGWQEVAALHSEFDIRPADTNATVVGVFADESYSGDVFIDDFAIQGSCDDTCLRWSDDIEALVRGSGIAPTATGFLCGNCESADALILVEVDDDGVRAVPQGQLADVLAPIDSTYEAGLFFGSIAGIREVESGWELIHRSYADCTPADSVFTLWSLTSDGKRSQVDEFVVKADLSEPEVCA